MGGLWNEFLENWAYHSWGKIHDMIWGSDTIQGSYDWDILKSFLYRT